MRWGRRYVLSPSFIPLPSSRLPFQRRAKTRSKADKTHPQIMSPNLSFYTLSLLNASSIFGRILPNLIADTTGPLNIMLPSVLITFTLAFSWLSIHTSASLIVFCILYGFFSGTFVSLPPTTIVTLSPSLGVVGTRMGMCFAIAGLGLLAGTPVAGQLILRVGFRAAIAFSGGTTALGWGFMVCARLAKAGPRLRVTV